MREKRGTGKNHEYRERKTRWHTYNKRKSYDWDEQHLCIKILWKLGEKNHQWETNNRDKGKNGGII